MKRVVTALVLVPFFCYIMLWAPQWAFLITVAIVAVLCFREYADLAALHGIGKPGLFGYAAGLLLGVAYVFGSLRCGIELRAINPYWLFFAYSLNWAGDIAALYVGRMIGRHKLAPNVSPAKSWEGSIGSTVASVIYGALYFHWLLPKAPLFGALALTVIANIAGQLGDLCESAMKRGAG